MRFLLLLLLLIAQFAHAQPIIVPPPGAGGGVGDITGIWSCVEGHCESLAVPDDGLLDFSAVNPASGGDGLIIPQTTDCSAMTAEGALCWDTDDEILYVGTGSGVVNFGGDITAVFDCVTGACTGLAPADGELIDLSGVAPNTTTEGLILPQTLVCSSATAEGQACWDTDNDVLHIGDGATTVAIGTGSGDITDIFDCSSADCSSVALSDGDLLDMSAVNNSSTTEGLLLPQAAACSSATAEGQICWDTDDDLLYTGTGLASVAVGSGDITDVFGCSSGDCASIDLADGEFLNFANITLSTNSEGLRLPQGSACTSQTADGQICWDTDDDKLYVGNNTSAVEIAQGDITAVFDCVTGACTGLAPSDDQLVDFRGVTPSNTSEGLYLPGGDDCADMVGDGQICWDADDELLSVGNGVSVVTVGAGDITDVFDCAGGNCSSISLTDGDLLNMSAVSVSGTGEGLILPQQTDCSAGTAEGQVCWDTDDNALYIGDGAAALGGGDISDVFGCAQGDCSSVALADGDLLDMSAVSVSSATEGLILPQNSTACTSATAEGQVCWDSTTDQLIVGDGATTVTIGGGAGDITDVFDCATGNCSSIALTDGDLLDMSAVDPDSETEGIILPQSTACTSNTAEGQLCWDTNDDRLWIGDGVSIVEVTQPTATLDEVFDNGKTIDGANSQANAFTVGDGTDGWRFYVGAGGPTQECFQGAGDCDYQINVADTYDFILNLNGTPGLTISSAGAVTLGAAMKEIHRASYPAGMMGVDGTGCSKNTDVTLNAEPFPATVTCTDSNDATIYIDFPAPEAWDEAYLTLKGTFVQQDATPDGNINIDWSGYCAGHNDPFGHNTFTAEDPTGAMDFAANGVADNDLLEATTTGQVPIGACAEGDMVRIRGQVDAAGTTAATPEDVHMIWLTVYIKVNDWSN